jgi:hypothetical protein
MIVPFDRPDWRVRPEAYPVGAALSSPTCFAFPRRLGADLQIIVKVALRDRMPQEKFKNTAVTRHFLFANPVDARHIRFYCSNRT